MLAEKPAVGRYSFCPALETILRSLRPRASIPRLALLKEKYRGRNSDAAAPFGDLRVTLHCYRYAWAERAKMCGYPERFAQEALGHNSKAVHRAYARKAQVRLPSLESYETRTWKAALFHCFRPCQSRSNVTRFRRLVKCPLSRNRHSRLRQ